MWYNRTGQNIKIAIIDSGFPKCNGGVSVYDDIITDEDFAFDSLQHGAIIADIIDFYSPDAELYSVKIFHDDLNCSINQLEKGISWCIDHDMDIINISAAFQYEENNDNIILDFCRQATKNGILIVSAVDTQRELTIPGVLEGVIAVQNDSNLPIGKWKIAEKNKSTINANGYWNTSVIKNRAIPGSNSFGSSNSCAFVTAMIAKLLEESHDICLKNILISLKVYENIGINSYSELNKNNYALLPITPDNYYLLDFYNINRIFAFRWMGLSEQLSNEKYPTINKELKIINDIDELLSYQDYDTVITSYLNNEYNNISHEKFLEIIVKIITAGKKVLFLSDLNIEDEIILSREFINHGGEFYVKKYKPLTNRYNTPNISNNDISINTNNRILFLSTSFYNITSKIEIDLYNKTKDKYDFITKNNYIRLIGLFNEEEYITALERTNNPNVVMTLNRPIFSISKDVIKQLSIIDNIKCCINFRPTKLILIITYPDPIEFIKDYINFVKLFFNIDVEKMVLSEVSLDVTLYSTDEHTYLPVDRNKIKRYLKELQKNIDIPILTYNEINIL